MMKYALSLLITVLTIGMLYAQPKKVLFIGNSYTFYNDLPQLVKSAAESTGDSLIVDNHTPGGARFLNHANSATATNKINSDNWDYVVLQGQSQEPSWPINQVQVEVFPYAEDLCETIRANDACSRPLFFMTWGRKNGDASNCVNWPPVCTYEGMDSLLQLRYNIMADDNDAYVAPVAAVWRYIRENHPGIELYTGDGSHPSPAGSYAAACTFYTVIFEKDPALIEFDFIMNAADAEKIRNAASLIVFENLEEWNIGAYDPVANFTFETENETVSFTNSSALADAYFWDFGDGAMSTAENPQHIYTATGDFEVTLIASNCGVMDTVTNVVEILTVTSVSEQQEEDLIFIYPNPTDSNLFISGSREDIERYRILDTKGAVLLEHDFNKKTIDLNLLTPGVYYLELQMSNGFNAVRKIIKN